MATTIVAFLTYYKTFRLVLAGNMQLNWTIDFLSHLHHNFLLADSEKYLAKFECFIFARKSDSGGVRILNCTFRIEYQIESRNKPNSEFIIEYQKMFH